MCSVGRTGPLGHMPGGGPKGPNLPYFQASVFWSALAKQLHFLLHISACLANPGQSYSKTVTHILGLCTKNNKMRKTLCTHWQSSGGQLTRSIKHHSFQLPMRFSSSFAYALGYSESTVSEITAFVFASGDDLIAPKRGYQRNTINYVLFAFFPGCLLKQINGKN